MDAEHRKTLLVVDDNKEERTIFSTYLEFVGYDVHTARDGAEGLQLACDIAPDLILLDMRMPVLDGWQTIERLRKDPRTGRIPVMALTAHQFEWQSLVDAGFCGYLEKPLAPYRVLVEIEQCVGKPVVPETTGPTRWLDRHGTYVRLHDGDPARRALQ